MTRLDEADALAVKYPKPVGELALGQIVTYYNPDGPPGYRAMAVVFLAKNGDQMSVVHADLPSIAQQKAADYWALNEKRYVPKVDKRRTTDPHARLARTLDRLAAALEVISPTETDDAEEEG